MIDNLCRYLASSFSPPTIKLCNVFLFTNLYFLVIFFSNLLYYTLLTADCYNNSTLIQV